MERKTVFVVGAGASKEANLPTGYELKEKISGLLDIRFSWDRQESGDYIITEALRIYASRSDGKNGDINPYLHEAWHIRDALPQAISIDNFIDAHRDNEKIALCGKLAIVKSILAAEQNSNLYFERTRADTTINFKQLEDTWYIPFFQLITESCGFSDLVDRFKSLTLIVFNYDRCIEHFIYHALQNYYRVSEEDAVQLISHINIYHPYGSVGSLPWIDRKDAIVFGEEPNANKLLELSRYIKTFAEGTDPNASEITKIRDHMNKATHIVFLGFAFHKLNMQLMEPATKSDKIIKCYASTLNISESNKLVIEDLVVKTFGSKSKVKVNMKNLKCGPLFNEYGRSLSF